MMHPLYGIESKLSTRLLIKEETMPVAPFLAYIFLTAFTPGPNNIMAMSYAGNFGLKRALVFSLGTFFGFLIVMSACAAAGSLLYAAVPAIEPWLRAAGTAYILILAWMIFRSGESGSAKAGTNGFLNGLAMQLVNVKVIIYGLTAMSVFILPHHSAPGRLTGFVLILSLVGLAGTSAWACGGRLMQKLFQTHRRVVNTVLALSLVVCAVSSL